MSSDEGTAARPAPAAGETADGAGVEQALAISVRDLEKRYPVYASPLAALREVFTGRKQHTDFRALDGVSFDVRCGERVGIVGANGAGKSTLLKVLAGTVDHTGGAFTVAGRLRAILELGTGFHEESTGRENILLGGLCLGYGRAELLERSNWIIDFSELGPVIDRPLRTYSNGMKMRLMYAVAFCRPVEIMIIDEALATGDGAFVRKCTNHIVELCGEGTTALIVSHNLYFLERICHRVLYLRAGRIVADGDPLEICKLYERDLGRRFLEDDQPSPRAGDASPGRAEPDEPVFVRDRSPADGQVAEPVVVTPGAPFVDDRPIYPDMLESDGKASGSPGGNGVGEVLQPDGSLTPLDFTGAPAVRRLGLVRLLEAHVFDADGRPTEEVVTGRPCRFRFVLESRIRKRAVHVGFMIWNDHAEHVATSTNVCSLDGSGRPNSRRLDLTEGVFTIDVVFPSLRLGAGRYSLRFGVAPGWEHYSVDDLLVSEDRCLAFLVSRPDHVQTVHYEPHSVWQPLVAVGALDTTRLPVLDLPGPAAPAPGAGGRQTLSEVP